MPSVDFPRPKTQINDFGSGAEDKYNPHIFTISLPRIPITVVIFSELTL